MDKSKFLSADERILLALYLINQEKPISWLTGWLAPEYKGKNVYSTLSRLAKRQLVDRIGEIGEIGGGKYRMTQLGIAWLERRFPLVAPAKTPSQPQKVSPFEAKPPLEAVIIDAAEIKGRRRKLIFDELKRWRYGRLARGVYLTAAPAAQTAVAEFVNRYRLSGYVNLMAIQPAEGPGAAADRVFRLKERNSQWRLLIDRMFEWKNRSEGSQPQTGLRRIRQDFLQMLITEPGLPPQLLPENYFMNSAIKHIISAQS